MPLAALTGVDENLVICFMLPNIASYMLEK